MASQLLSFNDFQAAIRTNGVEASTTAITRLPSDAAAQWALLKSFVGKPLGEIPKALVLLFTAPADPQRVAAIGKKIRALPAHERMIQTAGDDVFI